MCIVRDLPTGMARIPQGGAGKEGVGKRMGKKWGGQRQGGGLVYPRSEVTQKTSRPVRRINLIPKKIFHKLKPKYLTKCSSVVKPAIPPAA